MTVCSFFKSQTKRTNELYCKVFILVPFCGSFWYSSVHPFSLSADLYSFLCLFCLLLILCFAFCMLFTTACALKSSISVRKACIERILYQICVSDMQSLGLMSILLERMNSSLSTESAHWCLCSWSYLLAPVPESIWMLHATKTNYWSSNFLGGIFFKKELHHDFIEIYCVVFFIWFCFIYL